MILRITRGHLGSVTRSQFVTHVLESIAPVAGDIPGLRSFVAGLGSEPIDPAFAVVSTWMDVAAPMAALGSLDQSRWLRPLEPSLSGLAAAHFEVNGARSDGIVLTSGTTLQIASGRVRAETEELLFASLRERQERLLRQDVIAMHIGRRLRGTATEVIVAAIWRNADRARDGTRAGGRPVGFSPEWPRLLDNVNVESFEVVGLPPKVAGPRAARTTPRQ